MPDEPALDEQRDQILELALGQQLVGAHSLDRRRREAASEHRKAAEQELIGRVEQLVAPLERVLHGPATTVPNAVDVALTVGLALETLSDLADAQRRHTGSDELDRERHSIEPQADLGDRFTGPGVPRLEGPGSRTGPLVEQRDCARDVVIVAADDAAEALDHEPRDGPHVLALNPERLDSCHDHAQRRVVGEQIEDQVGDAGHDLVAVVDYQQRRRREPPR